MTTAGLREKLLRLEVALASRDPSGIEGGLLPLIADDFVELGRSGRAWDARSARQLLAGESSTPVVIAAFEIAELADGVVLATYHCPGPPAVNRASVWVRRDGRWQIRFHQGTPVPGPAARVGGSRPRRARRA